MKIKVKIPIAVYPDGGWNALAFGDDDASNNMNRTLEYWENVMPIACYYVEAELDVPVFDVESESVTRVYVYEADRGRAGDCDTTKAPDEEGAALKANPFIDPEYAKRLEIDQSGFMKVVAFDLGRWMPGASSRQYLEAFISEHGDDRDRIVVAVDRTGAGAAFADNLERAGFTLKNGDCLKSQCKAKTS